MKASLKKICRIFLLLCCLVVCFINKSMELEQEELFNFIAPWGLKKDEAISLMQQSVDFQAPKKIVELNQLKAIFDASDARVTLYEAFKCCSLTFDYFLHCIDLYGSIHSDTNCKNNKKCTLQ